MGGCEGASSRKGARPPLAPQSRTHCQARKVTPKVRGSLGVPRIRPELPDSPVITFNQGSMKAAYCRDPDGNVFEILEPRRAG